MVVDVIKWEPENDGSDVVCYKHDSEDFSCSAQLLVAPSQVALFVNEGEVIPFLPGHYTLNESNNSNIRFLQRWRTKYSEGVSSYHCSVYYVNMVSIQDLKFGTLDPILMEDAIEGVNIHVRAAGLFGAHIDNDDKDAVNVIKFFTKVVGTQKCFSKTNLADYLRGKVVERVKNLLGQAMVINNIGITKVSAYYSMLSDSLKEQMKPFFAEFGITLDNFSFMSINVPEEDLKAVNESKIAAKKQDLESAAMARQRAREGYSYQDEKGLEVLKAAASNEANISATMMGGGMGIGMGLGMAGAFQNLSNNALGNMTQPKMGMVVSEQGNAVCQQENRALENGDSEKCPDCGTAIPGGAKFCPSCGKKRGDYCPKCGSQITPGAKFCMNCGEKIKNSCANCGTELQPGAKFCPNCGSRR